MGDTAEDTKHVSQKRPLLTKSLMDSAEPEPTSRVLVIYTGGTIGMKTNDNGGLQKTITLLIDLKLIAFAVASLSNMLGTGHLLCLYLKKHKRYN